MTKQTRTIWGLLLFGLLVVVSIVDNVYFNGPLIGFTRVYAILSGVYVAALFVIRRQHIFSRWVLFCLKLTCLLAITAGVSYWKYTTYYQEGQSPSAFFPLVIQSPNTPSSNFDCLSWRNLQENKDKINISAFLVPDGQYSFKPDKLSRVTFTSKTYALFHQVKVLYHDPDYDHYGVYRVYDNKIVPLQYRINNAFLFFVPFASGLVTTTILFWLCGKLRLWRKVGLEV
jgi:hypothetical protein